MVGLQSTAIKAQLGPLLNGIVGYDFWLPWSGLASPEAKAFLEQVCLRADEHRRRCVSMHPVQCASVWQRPTLELAVA
jgi:hypothetical protein